MNIFKRCLLLGCLLGSISGVVSAQKFTVSICAVNVPGVSAGVVRVVGNDNRVIKNQVCSYEQANELLRSVGIEPSVATNNVPVDIPLGTNNEKGSRIYNVSVSEHQDTQSFVNSLKTALGALRVSAYATLRKG